MTLSDGYFEHRKTLTLVDKLGLGTEALPLRLWAYVSRHHGADGRLSGYTAQQIERIVGWRSVPGKLVAVLTAPEIGWLELLPEGVGFQCHQWREHQPRMVLAAEAEALAAQRVEQARVEWAARHLAQALAHQEQQKREAEMRRERARKGGLAKAERQAAPQAAPEQPSKTRSSNGRDYETAKYTSFDHGSPAECSVLGGVSTETMPTDDESPKAVNGGIRPNVPTVEGSNYSRGMDQLAEPSPEKLPELVRHALGSVRRLLRTPGDILINDTYCAELDQYSGGGVWGKRAKEDVQALDLACVELTTAKAEVRNGKRKEIMVPAAWLSRAYQKCHARLEQAREAKRKAGL